jgi:putative phosphoribosyl transferase
MKPIFEDRSHAGKLLAQKLAHHANDPSVLVLALSRGGVQVGFQVARELSAPLDVFVIRKLGVPGYEDLAMGAVASGRVRVLNDEVIQRLSIPPSAIEATAREEEQELARCEKAFRGSREPAQIERHTVILVDDGLATGTTMKSAVRALRRQNPAYLTVAVPISSHDTCDHFRTEVDELICGSTPEGSSAVGTWYANFLPTADDEVRELLDHAAHERRVRRVKEHKDKGVHEHKDKSKEKAFAS